MCLFRQLGLCLMVGISFYSDMALNSIKPLPKSSLAFVDIHKTGRGPASRVTLALGGGCETAPPRSYILEKPNIQILSGRFLIVL